MVSYSAGSGCPVRAAASWDPPRVRTGPIGWPGHPAECVCCAEAKRKSGGGHRQRLLGRHVVPAALGVAAGRRDRSPLSARPAPRARGSPRQAFAFRAVGQRRGSRIRGAADGARDPSLLLLPPLLAFCVRACFRGVTTRSAWQLPLHVRAAKAKPPRADRGCLE